MSGVKSLAKDTAIYGLSSILGRFLNWCLVPLYTQMFPPAEYGLVTFVYSIVALVLIILTYGMETGFFRFVNHERYKDPMEVYSTSLTSLAVSSSVFFVLLCVFVNPVCRLMECDGRPSFVLLMGASVALDAFTAIPFSYLRFRNRPMRFAMLRLINIGLNIGLNLFFILLCPWLWRVCPGLIGWFYDPTFGIGYIFLSNFITSALNVVLLIPELSGFRWRFNRRLWHEILVYSYPLLILGVAGIMNQTIDKIMLPWLVTEKATAMQQLGIYGANYKIAVVMVMFIQAFRFAYEPFIFSQSKERGEDKLQSYRDAMKWFVIFSMFIFLGVMFYLDVLRYFIAPEYFSGLKVVPVVMIAEFFFGVFFNLSLWYKLTDRTYWGAYFSLIGLAMTVLFNVLLVPMFGYMGCAFAALICYTVMMVFSYVVGRIKYPIGYNVPRLLLYFGLAIGLYALSAVAATDNSILNMAVRTPFLAVYVIVVLKVEKMNISQLLPINKILGFVKR